MIEFAITYAALGLITAATLKWHKELKPGVFPVVLTIAVWPWMLIALAIAYLLIWLIGIDLDEAEDDTP